MRVLLWVAAAAALVTCWVVLGPQPKPEPRLADTVVITRGFYRGCAGVLISEVDRGRKYEAQVKCPGIGEGVAPVHRGDF